MRVLLAVLAVAAAAATVSGAAIGSDIVIDGKTRTIGLTVADYFSGNIAEPFGIVMDVIIDVMAPPTPEEDIDYFELIKEDVATIVGQFINEHNMDQVEVYKDDLAVLMKRYNEAPESSTSYPNKNTMANSLSTSIIANRFLIEAVEWPHSMMLHYADIASIHIMVLHDAAVTYTTAGEVPSYWWVDLDQELDHYIEFGRTLENTVVDWRNDLVECSYAECVKKAEQHQTKICYDVWTIRDAVAEVVDECRVVSGDSECDDHCQVYQITMNRDVSVWVYNYLGKVMEQWQELKMLSAEMAAIVQKN